MQRKTRIVVGVTVAVVLVAGLVAGYRIRGQRQPWEDVPQASGATEQTGAHPLYQGTTPDAGLLQRKTAAAVRAKIKGDLKAAAEADRIAAVVSQAVTAYSTGTLEDYKALLRSQGLTADRPTLPGSQAGWEAASMLVRGQPLDPDNISAVALVTSGREVAKVGSRPGMSSIVGTPGKPRDEGDVLDPFAAGTDAVEVMIPGRLRGLDGEFNGSFSLTLARRPKDGQWIVIRIGAIDAPQHTKVPIPPL